MTPSSLVAEPTIDEIARAIAELEPAEWEAFMGGLAILLLSPAKAGFGNNDELDPGVA